MVLEESIRNKGSIWDGVRNYQARNNLKKMKLGDHFFYQLEKKKDNRHVKIS